MIALGLTEAPFEKDDNYKPMLEMALSRIRQLSAHEVGHTLGFAHNFAASVNNRSSVMDYPHPLIGLKDDEVDLSNAYSEGIGDWDKVSVAYSYSEFNLKNEKLALDNILNNSMKNGLRFITDSDARAKGGAHVSAHLWDNENDVVNGLDEIFKVRKKAILNFSELNIKSGEPLSTLEDVFVPLYFMHRYQTEAVVKLIGGMDYNYATRDDNQTIVKDVLFKDQNNALLSVLSTLEAKNLAIPKSITFAFPSRAMAYQRTRESFKSMTGVSFDPLSAVSTASEMTLSLLLNPERMNRLVIQSSLSNSRSQNMSLNYLLTTLTNNTFKLDNKFDSEFNDSYLFEVQQVINNNYLKFLLNLASNKKSFFQVKAESRKALSNIIQLLTSKKHKNKYSGEYLNIIAKFNSKPELFVLAKSAGLNPVDRNGSAMCNLNN